MSTAKQSHEHGHGWVRHYSPVTNEIYYVCLCGELTFDSELVERDYLLVKDIAKKLAQIMLAHLEGLSEHEKAKRIELGRQVLAAFKKGRTA